MHKIFTLKKTNKQINVVEPSKQCVNALLNYSKALEVKKSKLIENFVLIRN